MMMMMMMNYYEVYVRPCELRRFSALNDFYVWINTCVHVHFSHDLASSGLECSYGLLI